MAPAKKKTPAKKAEPKKKAAPKVAATKPKRKPAQRAKKLYDGLIDVPGAWSVRAIGGGIIVQHGAKPPATIQCKMPVKISITAKA